MENESYIDVHCFVTDVHRVVDDAMHQSSGINQRAKSWRREFDYQFKMVMTELHEAIDRMRW